MRVQDIIGYFLLLIAAFWLFLLSWCNPSMSAQRLILDHLWQATGLVSFAMVGVILIGEVRKK